MKKFIKKTWIYWIGIILTELIVVGIIIGWNYAISNNLPEIHQTAQIGSYTFTYEWLSILMTLITIMQIINCLVYALWNFFFTKIFNEYRKYKDENKSR